MKTVELTQGKQCVVDDEDWDWISKIKWSINGAGYAQGRIEGPVKSMHTEIMERIHGPTSMLVDHKNGNKLDNRRENLRLVTRSENSRSRPATGVDSYKNKWRARIVVDNKCIFLGYFDTKEEARYVRLKAERKHWA